MGDVDSKPLPQASGLARWTPSIPTNIIGMLNPFSNDESSKANAESDTASHLSNKNKSIFASFLPNPSSAEPESPDKDESVFFAEPETRTNSDDGSREGSVISEPSRKRLSKSSRPKTCYSICHPPPASTARQRFHRRPRSLLQLHKLSANARPQPAFEVIPSANFSVRLTRAITKVFKTKHGLCPNDLVVLKAEKYSKDEPNEEQEARDIIALICKGRKEDGGAPGKAKICLPEGREWEAYPTLNGGYEFFSTDEHGLGLTVRWVPKKSKDGSKAKECSKKKFNFSTISPNSRKHPVIATLGRTGLDINDTYKIPDPSAATPLSTPQQSASILAEAMEGDTGGKEQCETDDRLRQVIVMTAIWVAFKEGWSPNFKYDDKDKDISAVQRSPSLQQSPAKSATFGSPVSTPPGSPAVTPVPLEKRNSFMGVGSGILRKGSLLGRGNRNSSASVPEAGELAQAEGAKKTGRTRADSASTVLVHRAASNRAKHRQATWRPDLVSEIQEATLKNISRSPSAPSASVVAPFNSFSSPPERRQSIARPILPPSHASDSSSDSQEMPSGFAAIPRSTSAEPPSPEKRESSTTTTTNSSRGVPSKASQQAPSATRMKKKKSGWRRLLCGSGDDI